MTSPAARGVSDEAPEVTLRSLVVPIFGPSVLFGITEGAVMPVIALTAIDRGASTAVAALIAAMIGVGSILSNIPASRLADRVGERRAIFVAAAMSAGSLVLCVLPLGLWVLGLGVLGLGAASAVFTLARQMYLTEAAPHHLRARALSALGGSMRIGMFLGPFIGAGVMQWWGLSSAYWVAVVAVVLAGLVAGRVPDLEVPEAIRQASSETTARHLLRDHRHTFLTVGLGVVLLSAVRQSRQVVIPLWAHHLHLDPATTSVIYGVSGGIDALVFYPGGLAMDRFGRKYASVSCLALLSLSFVVMPLAHSTGALALVAVLMGVGNGLGSGIVMTLGADTSPRVGRALYLGVWRELSDVGTGGGPLLLSALTAVAGLGASIATQGVLGAAGALAFLRWVVNKPVERDG